jgi:hypothetical protein
MRYISIFNQLDQRLRYLHVNHKIPSSQPQWDLWIRYGDAYRPIENRLNGS